MKLPTFMSELDQETYDFDKSCEEVATQRGLIVVYPKHNQLQLDLDSEEQFAEYERRKHFFQFEGVTEDVRESASGFPKRHVTLTFEKESFDPWTRIAMQSSLASDPIREFLSARRLRMGVERPSCLFERPL